jgi:deazaflavin-dependent oxidoreductase (nitroreductase family)
MRKFVGLAVAVAVAVGGCVTWWRRHPRFGASWVNRVVDPWLVRQGVVAGSKGEVGLLEHVGRRTGQVRITPVHPVGTEDGFRIIVPLGVQSHWARNVLAAGRCRLQVGGLIYELDEPRFVMATEVDSLPTGAARVMDWLGFRYLVLRRFAESPGTLAILPATDPARATIEAAPSMQATSTPQAVGAV